MAAAVRVVARGAGGRDLIAALQTTSAALLVTGVGLGLGLALVG